MSDIMLEIFKPETRIKLANFLKTNAKRAFTVSGLMSGDFMSSLLLDMNKKEEQKDEEPEVIPEVPKQKFIPKVLNDSVIVSKEAFLNVILSISCNGM